MSDTIPDLKITSNEYLDIYLSTGITVSTELSIQNKRSKPVYVQVSPTKPDHNSTDGYLLLANQSCVVKGSISKVWVSGDSTISVQIYED